MSLVALLGIFQAYLCMWKLSRNKVDITCNGRSGDIDGMQFGFMAGGRTTDAIWSVRQVQEKMLERNYNI